MSKLSKNIFYNCLGQGSLLILGVFAIRITFKHLGPEALGIITFAQILNSVIQIALELGISSCTVREVSSNLASDPHYIHRLTRTFSLFYWVAFSIAAILLFFLAPVFANHWLHLTTIDTSTVVTVIRVLGLASITALPGGLYSSLLIGLERMGTTNLIAVLTAIVQQGGTILVLLLRGSFLSVIYWYAACYCLRALLLFGASSRHFVMRSFLPGYFPDVVLRNWHYASRMLFTSITGFIYSQADRVIISKLMLVSTLGYYNVAYSTVSKATLLTSSVSTAAFPMLSDLFKSADRGKLMAQYYKLHDLLCVASIPLLAAVPFAAMPLFSYLFNPEVARQLLLPTVLLSAAFYMNAILTIPYTFSLAVGRPDIGARQHFFDLFVVPPLTVLLIYEFGIVGAALSSVLLYAFHLAYALRRLCSECLHISARLWFRHIARMLCLAGATYGVAFGLVWTQGSFHLDRLLLAYAVASLAFLCVAYFIVNSDLRLAILRQLPFRTNIGTGI